MNNTPTERHASNPIHPTTVPHPRLRSSESESTSASSRNARKRPKHIGQSGHRESLLSLGIALRTDPALIPQRAAKPLPDRSARPVELVSKPCASTGQMNPLPSMVIPITEAAAKGKANDEAKCECKPISARICRSGEVSRVPQSFDVQKMTNDLGRYYSQPSKWISNILPRINPTPFFENGALKVGTAPRRVSVGKGCGKVRRTTQSKRFPKACFFHSPLPTLPRPIACPIFKTPLFFKRSPKQPQSVGCRSSRRRS